MNDDAATFISDVAMEVLTSQPENVFDTDDILIAESTIAAAIGGVLETIDAAAGDEQTREDLLNLDEPPAGDERSVSPSWTWRSRPARDAIPPIRTRPAKLPPERENWSPAGLQIRRTWASFGRRGRVAQR